MPMLAADISSHNQVTDWAAFLASIDALMVKATEGLGYVWAGAPGALSQARGAGKPCGAYHFYGGNDPASEADYFLGHYGWRPGEIPVLDCERGSVALPADPDPWCAGFTARVRDRIGVVPMIYMSASVARASSWARTRALNAGLWVAQYGANTGAVPAAQPAVGAWGSYAMWQFTSNGSRPGVASPPLDLSQFYGTADQWRAYGSPGGDMPLTNDDITKIMDWPFAAMPDGSVVNFGNFLKLIEGRVEAVAAKVGQVQATPQVDPQVFTAAFHAWLDANKDTIVPQLGRSIAASVQLTPRTDTPPAATA